MGDEIALHCISLAKNNKEKALHGGQESVTWGTAKRYMGDGKKSYFSVARKRRYIVTVECLGRFDPG